MHWRRLGPHEGEDRDPGWDHTRCLYLYLPPRGKEILYIGKTNKGTVEGRFNADDKREGIFERLRRERGITHSRTLLGDISYDEDIPWAPKILADVETLLIHRLQPWGNRSAKKSRTSRPGMRVVCKGEDWPHKRRTFLDRG